MFPLLHAHRYLQRNTDENFQFPFLNLLTEDGTMYVHTETTKTFVNNRVILVFACGINHMTERDAFWEM